VAGDRLEAALEAACEALIELQLIRTVGGNEVNAHANLAIESLRRAIVELRAGRGEQPSALAPGFVTGDAQDGSAEAPAVAGQSNP
jgi:hypothetical protein